MSKNLEVKTVVQSPLYGGQVIIAEDSTRKLLYFTDLYRTYKVGDVVFEDEIMEQSISFNDTRIDSHLASDYTRVMAASMYCHTHKFGRRHNAPVSRTALHLGMGLAGLPRYLQFHGLYNVAVEMDPAVVYAASFHYNLNFPILTCHASAGLTTVKGTYDLVFFDCFTHEDIGVAEEFTEFQFCKKLGKAVSPEGILVLNTYGAESKYKANRDELLRRMNHQGFVHAIIFTAPKYSSYDNVVIYMSRERLSLAKLKSNLATLSISKEHEGLTTMASHALTWTAQTLEL